VGAKFSKNQGDNFYYFFNDNNQNKGDFSIKGIYLYIGGTKNLGGYPLPISAAE